MSSVRFSVVSTAETLLSAPMPVRFSAPARTSGQHRLLRRRDVGNEWVTADCERAEQGVESRVASLQG